MVQSLSLEKEMNLDCGPTEEVEEIIKSYNGEPDLFEKRRILSLIVNRLMMIQEVDVAALTKKLVWLK